MSSQGWCLLTFGGGSFPFRNAARRFAHTARRSHWFQQTRDYTDVTLAKQFPDFVATHAAALRPGSRGYGYYIWKAFLIHQTLRSIPPDCLGVVWMDSGNTLNVTPSTTGRMHEYFTIAGDTGALGFALRKEREFEYTKADTCTALGATEKDLSTFQVITTAVFLRRGEDSLDLTAEWSRLGCADDYHLIDDSPSRQPESPGFIAHRHDQSLWSLLAKKTGVSILPDETYHAPNWREQGAALPIWAVRQRSGTPALSSGYAWDLVRQMEQSVGRTK